MKCHLYHFSKLKESFSATHTTDRNTNPKIHRKSLEFLGVDRLNFEPTDEKFQARDSNHLYRNCACFETTKKYAKNFQNLLGEHAAREGMVQFFNNFNSIKFLYRYLDQGEARDHPLLSPKFIWPLPKNLSVSFPAGDFGTRIMTSVVS